MVSAAVPQLRDPRLLLGISSGTSADGIDLALVEVSGRGPDRKAVLVAGETAEYPAELRSAVRDAAEWKLADSAHMHFRFGECFGTAARDFLARQGVRPEAVSAAGSHGQTVFHHDGDPRAGTLQLGDPSVTAARLGVRVVGDFRWDDLAAGGQGAPISPFADWVLHRRAAPRLAVLNLGGIGNLTLLEGESPPRAWDTGPANGPLDALVRREAGRPWDAGGRLAARGRVRPELLAALQADPFFARPLPRSTGLERFGEPLALALRRRAPLAPLPDLLATLVQLAAWAVAGSLELAGWPGGPVFACGGGARNPVLQAALGQELQQRWPGEGGLRPYGELGWDPDLREAVAFALLADARLCGEPASWPSTTGATAPVRLGRVALP